MKLSHLQKLFVLAALALGVPAGIALATPGFRVISAPVIARATVDADNFKLKLRDSSNAADAVIQ